MIQNQVINDQYSIYEADCMDIFTELPDNSLHLTVYSPPFTGLYNYSSSPNDFSNCASKEEFLQQYDFLIKEIARITMPGRITAVHVMEIINQKGSNFDFPHEVIKLHEKYGFDYKNRITIWKEPLKVRMRTMVQSLMHKFIVEDSTKCFTASPDYVLIFKKKGENPIPVTHPFGLHNYAGSEPILPNMLIAYNNAHNTSFNKDELWEILNNKYHSWEDPRTNKLAHIIWQRYASSMWTDVRVNNVLSYKDSKDPDDEKHIHPLQLDVIDRLVELYSNPGEVVATPFMGVGSEVYCAVSMGRKALGVELKPSYFKQSVKNLKSVKNRYDKNNQLSINTK